MSFTSTWLDPHESLTQRTKAGEQMHEVRTQWVAYFSAVWATVQRDKKRAADVWLDSELIKLAPTLEAEPSNNLLSTSLCKENEIWVWTYRP